MNIIELLGAQFHSRTHSELIRDFDATRVHGFTILMQTRFHVEDKEV